MSFYPCGRADGKLEGRKEVSDLADAQVGDELFGLPPEEFVAARDELARRLKREGDAEAARRVKALRRPSLSAWAVNQLACRQGAGLGPLLAAGERLRAAHQAALAGEGADELRAAAKAEREAVAGLVEDVLELLREAGHAATDAVRDRVAATLHAAAVSQEAADLVRDGRLTTDLDPSGFGTVPEGAFEAPAGIEKRPRRERGDRAAAGRPTRARREAAEDGDRAPAVKDDPAARRARRAAAVAARDDARRRARLAADQAVLATRQAERLGRLADQAEREAGRARTTANAAIEAASAARERAARAARDLREAEDRIPADH
jgi:hypothetical protein